MKIDIDNLKEGEQVYKQILKDLELAYSFESDKDSKFYQKMNKQVKDLELKIRQAREAFEKAEQINNDISNQILDKVDIADQAFKDYTSISKEEQVTLDEGSTTIDNFTNSQEATFSDLKSALNTLGQIDSVAEANMDILGSEKEYTELLNKMSKEFKIPLLEDNINAEANKVVLEYNLAINNMFDANNTKNTAEWKGQGVNLSDINSALFYFKKDNGEAVFVNTPEYEDCLKNNINLQLVETEKYKNLKMEAVEKLGFASKEEAAKIISLMCTSNELNKYVSVGDKIIDLSLNNLDVFEKAFGYSLIDENGMQKAELLYLDLFKKMNFNGLLTTNQNNKVVVNKTPRIVSDKNFVTRVTWL